MPWFANDNVPVSSETTIQIHLSNLSVIPNAAKCLVPYLLIPCLERGSITPADIILLPLTRTAPSCKGVSVAKRLIKRSGVDHRMAINIINSQLDIEKKIELCDFMIWNCGNLEQLNKQIEYFMLWLKAKI